MGEYKWNYKTKCKDTNDTYVRHIKNIMFGLWMNNTKTRAARTIIKDNN